MIYLCIVKKNNVMSRSKSKFRVLSVHQNGDISIFYRPTLQSCLKFVRECFVKLYPTYGNVIYYIQEFNFFSHDYVSLITCDYYYSDLPF